MGFDGRLDLLIARSHSGAILHSLGDFLNILGKGDVLAFACILLAIAGFFSLRALWLKTAAGGILAVTAAGIIVQICKHLFGRSRPQMNLGDLNFIGPNLAKNGFDSFPSGHAAATFAFAAFFSFYFPRLRIPLYLLAACVSLIGRVFLRNHFLSDAIAGAFLGAFLGFWFARRLRGWTLSESPLPADGGEKSAALDQGKPAAAKHILWIVLAASLTLMIGLSSSALWDRDETEYAQAVTEMQKSGSWLIPTLEGQPFLEKPILMYWPVKASFILLGPGELAARLPSGVFGLLSCLALYFLGRKLFDARTGLLGSLILSSSFLFIGGSRLLLTDPFFTFFTLLALLFYTCSLKEPSRSVRFLVLSYAATGLALLSKGPVAFFVPALFVLFETLRGGTPLFSRFLRSALKHSLYSLVAVMTAAPWFLHSFSVQKEATSTFFLYENLSRFLKGAEGHTGPMFYYVPVLFLGLLPWAPFIFPEVKKIWRENLASGRPFGDDASLLLLWPLFLFLFFSFSSTKLPHYMLPALPPLALLIARHWRREARAFSSRLWIGISFALSLVLILAPAALYFVRPQYASLKLIFPFLLFGSALGAAHVLWPRLEGDRRFLLVWSAAVLLQLSLSFCALPDVERHRVMKPIALAIKQNVPQEAALIGYHISEPSLFFYSGRLFPKIEDKSLDEILKSPSPTYVVTEKSEAEKAKRPYTVAAEAKGFAENSGELTLLLISNRVK